MVLVFITIFLGWVGFSMPYPVFSHLFLNEGSPLSGDASLELRTIALGLGLALYPVGQILGSFILGHASDKYGRKLVLQLALTTTVVGSIFLAFGVSFSWLIFVLIGRFIAGFGEGSIAIVQSIAADVSQAHTKARNFALIGIAMDAGFIVGPVLGGLLVPFPGGTGKVMEPSGMVWALPFWAALVLFTLNALMVPIFLRKPVPQLFVKVDEEESKKNISQDTILYNIISFAAFWSIASFFDFFPVYFIQLYNTAPAQLGINAALLSVPLILTGFVIGPVINHFGKLAVAVASFVLMGIGQITFLLAESELQYILPVICAAVGITAAQAATSMLVSDAASGQGQGKALGLYRSVSVTAGACAALVGGVLSALDPGLPFLASAIVCTGGAGLLVIYGLKRRQEACHNYSAK